MQKYIVFIIIIIFVFPFELKASSKIKKDKKEKHKVELPRASEPDPYVEIKKDVLLSQAVVAHCGSRRLIENMTEGIDVSHYQGSIDWSSVAKGGKISYAFVKASESNYFIDDYYDYNISEGRKHGITMGSYHFFRANVNMTEQFHHMISVIDPKKQDIVPMIDVEAANGVSSDRFAKRLKEFLDMVENYYGRPPILYTYVNFYNKYMAYRGFDRYPLMIAFYNELVPSVDDGNQFIMWQYSCRGRIDGIRGDVDRSKIMSGFSIYDILMYQ